MNTAFIHWKRLPLLRLLLPFLLGIILWDQWEEGLLLAEITAVTGTLLLGVMTYLRIAYSRRWIYGAILQITFFALGYLFCWLQDPYHRSDHFRHQPNDPDYWIAQIQDVKRYPSYQRLILEIKGCSTQHKTSKCSGLLLAYASQTDTVQPGHYLQFQGQPRSIQNSQWPGAFDRSTFWKRRYVRHQLSLKSGDYQQILNERPQTGLQHWRSNYLNVLRSYLHDPEVYGIVSAMLLGERDYLESATYDLYVRTGSIHVLAVSGLHVGMVYLLLVFLCRHFPKTRPYRILRAGLLLTGIWLYAFLTGASPSVLRATTMFSLIIVGEAFDRDGHLFNSLAGAALFLLYWQPYWLFSPGFQLSFLAVAGIAYFQRRIFRLWVPPYRLLDWVWTGISVSLAAQLTTTPISLYYFHQFPNYFWLSGLIVIPAAPFILIAGALLLATHYLLPIIAPFLATGLSTGIRLVNGLLEYIDQLPGSWIDGIPFDLLDMILVLVMIWFLAGLWEKRSGKWAIGLLLALHLFLAWQIKKDWDQRRQYEIYAIRERRESILYAKIGTRGYLQVSDPQQYQEVADRLQEDLRVNGVQQLIPVTPDTLLQAPGLLVKNGWWQAASWAGRITGDTIYLAQDSARRRRPLITPVFDGRSTGVKKWDLTQVKHRQFLPRGITPE